MAETVNKTLEEKIKQGRQYRSMMMEIRKDDAEPEKDTYIVEGYASTFNDPYTLFDFGDWRYDEQIDSRAFDGCDFSDVIMQYDHQGKVYARGSMVLLKLKLMNMDCLSEPISVAQKMAENSMRKSKEDTLLRCPLDLL